MLSSASKNPLGNKFDFLSSKLSNINSKSSSPLYQFMLPENKFRTDRNSEVRPNLFECGVLFAGRTGTKF